jgi:2-polyprenyl-6-methoxyphenol hydroxylase-like FAD-dependent oxidoreductase
VRVRIIDKAAEPGTTSRALVVHARTLELYRQLGIAERVVRAGLEFTAVNLWVAGERAAHIALGDMGRGSSAFPYMVIYPQDEHERMLIGELESLGVVVERNVELLTVRDGTAYAEAQLRDAAGNRREVRARYVAGADGAHSAARGALDVGFPGGTYDRMFYVADVEATGPVMNRELHIALDTADFVGVFPMAGDQRARLIGSVRASARRQDRPIGWDDVSEHAIARMKIDVRTVNWFSTYHVHHRVASRFRQGRIFLLGDAAHIHSPVGGQGMNTGIGDAVNLAWKLGNVIRDSAPESLLDSYEPERIAFARRLVATTDRAFTIVTRDGPIARLIRLHVLPAVAPVLARSAALRRYMFRALSQTAIEYRSSALSVGRAGEVRAGDRLPWVERATLDGGDNYASLGSRAWQIHIYGSIADGIEAVAATRGIGVTRFPWQAAMRRAGLRQNAMYLVRPDGHIGFVDADSSADALSCYVDGRLRGFTRRAGSGYLRSTL